MVWNKTPASVVQEIKRQLHNFNLRYSDIAQQLGVSEHTVCQINSTMPKEFKAIRYSGINRAAKLKSNPMTGKTGTKHHNSIEGAIKAGHYLAVWAPDWWTGPVDGGRVLMHQVVWAENNKFTYIPLGHVVHHKDHDKNNNSPDNLELMTRKAHALHHAADNFWKSATTISKESRV